MTGRTGHTKDIGMGQGGHHEDHMYYGIGAGI